MIEVMDVFSKALLPMVFRVLGRSSLVMELQPEKAFSPIFSSLEPVPPKVIKVMDSQPSNALAPMEQVWE